MGWITAGLLDWKKGGERKGEGAVVEYDDDEELIRSMWGAISGRRTEDGGRSTEYRLGHSDEKQSDDVISQLTALLFVQRDA